MRREAERRTAHLELSGCRQGVAAVTDAGAAPLWGPLAFRRSTAALAKKASRPWLGPVPRFMEARRVFIPPAPRAASSSQTGVGAGRAGFRTARTRFAKPRAGTALAPPSGSHPECALRRARCVCLVRRAARDQETSPNEPHRADLPLVFKSHGGASVSPQRRHSPNLRVISR
jgi:hypothetical protein